MRVHRGDSGGFPRRSHQVVWKALQSRGILLNLEDGAYFEVGPVGLEVWKRCDGRTPLAKIVQAMEKSFPRAGGRVGRDVSGFIGQLRKVKLIR